MASVYYMSMEQLVRDCLKRARRGPAFRLGLKTTWRDGSKHYFLTVRLKAGRDVYLGSFRLGEVGAEDDEDAFREEAEQRLERVKDALLKADAKVVVA